MGITVLAPLCVIAAMCMSHSSLDRTTGDVTNEINIVTGAQYEFLLSQPPVPADGLFYVAKDGEEETTYPCSAMYAGRYYQCTPTLTVTAGSAGTVSDVWKTNSFADESTLYSWNCIAPIPSQPSIAWSTDDQGATVYELSTSKYSSSYGTSLSACLLAYAPSDLLYDGSDFPSLWPRDNSSFVFVSSAPGVMSKVWLNPAENSMLSDRWDEITTSTVRHDYFFACYNDAGASFQRSLFNFGSKAAPASAPVIYNTTMYRINDVSWQIELTFQDLNQYFGVYNTAQCRVDCDDCNANQWIIPAGNTNNTVSFSYDYYMYAASVMPFTLRCGATGAELTSLPTEGYFYGPLQAPSSSCELGYCSDQEAVEGANVTIVSTSGSVGSTIAFYMLLTSQAGVETVHLGSCTNNQDPSVVQTCRSPVAWNFADAIAAAYTNIKMCNILEYTNNPLCVYLSLINRIPSKPQVTWEYSYLTDYVVNQERELERWNATLKLSTSEFSSEYGASLDGCCLFYVDYETSFPQLDSYTQAVESELDHFCVASPQQSSTVSYDPRGLFNQSRAGQYLDIYYMCFNQFGSSLAGTNEYQLVLEAPPSAPSIAVYHQTPTIVRVDVVLPGVGEYNNPGYDAKFSECSVWAVPGGANMSTPKADSVWHEFQVYDWANPTLNFPHVWQIYPSVDVYAQCNNRLGQGQLLKQTLALSTYLTVNCLNPAYCPFVTQKSGRFSPYEVVQSIVIGAMLNISGNCTSEGSLSFGLGEEVDYGHCEIVDGGCSLANTINFTSTTTQQLTQIYVTNSAVQEVEFYYLLPVGSAPSQPQLDISLDAPSGVNSTITFTTSFYASEYSDDGQTNLTECLLVWSDDWEFEQYVVDYRSMNSSNSYSFVPSHQGQQLTLNFNDVLPVNMSGVTLHYFAQCYNLIGGSTLMIAYDLTAIPSLPEPAVSFSATIGDWDHFLVDYQIPARSGSVGYQPVSSDDLLWNRVNVTIVVGYTGFNVSLGEANFTYVAANQYQGNSPQFWIYRNEIPSLDFSWSSSWDFYLFVTNEFGTSEPVMTTQQFDFTPDDSDYQSPMYMYLDDSYYSQDTDFCRTCHFDPSEGTRYSHYDILQNNWYYLAAYIYGTFHQRVQVVMTANSMTNYTLFDGFISAGGYATVDLNGLFNISNVTLGTEYQVTAISVTDLATEVSSFKLRVVNRAPVQTYMLYMGPNDLSYPYSEMVTDTFSGLLIDSNFGSESDLFGCMLVWGPSSSLYEADDLPDQFNGTYNNARVASGTGRFVSTDELYEEESSSRYFSFNEFVPNTTISAQDFHLACWNTYGRSRKASVYNVVAHVSASSEVQSVNGVVDESNLTSLDVTVRLPLLTGDMGVSSIGSAMQFANCSFEWIVDDVVVGSFQPTAAADYVLTVDSELNFTATGLDLFTHPAVIFATQCFGNMSGPGMSRNFTFVWQNPYHYSDVLVVDMKPQYAISSIVQWVNFSNENSTVVSTIVEGTVVNITMTYQPYSQLSLVDLGANNTILSSCDTGLSGSCELTSFTMPTSGTRISYRVVFNDTVYVDMSYLSVAAVPTQPHMSLINVNSTTSLLLTVSEHSAEFNSSLIGCVLSAGTAASSFVVPSGITYANAINEPSTLFVLNGSAASATVLIDQQHLAAAHLVSGELYHFYWVCYNEAGASAPSALFSVPAFNAPISSSSSTGASASSSASSSQSSSASDNLSMSSSTASPTSSSAISSSSAVQGASSSSSAGNASSVKSSSSSVVSAQSSTGPSDFKVSSSSSAAIQTVSSSSSAMVVVPTVPVGTVKVSFSVSLPEGPITVTFIVALTNDILSTIARLFVGLTVDQIRQFVVINIDTNPVSSNRRLLDQSVSVSFTLLGNITTVTGNTTVVGSDMTVDATSIATSLVGAIANGTLDSTESASLGMSVPVQPNLTVQPVITPVESSSSTGVLMDDDDSSSSLSDGGIAGAVIGSIVGAALLLALAFAIYSGALSSLFSSSPSVAQANANDIKTTKKVVEPRETSVEMGAANNV